MPSLLTPAQQAEADRNRILTKLEHGKAGPQPVEKTGSRKAVWGASGILALALAGGAVFLNADDKGGKPAAPAVLAAAAVAPVRAEPPVVKAPEPEEVSAAAILDEPAPAAAPNTGSKGDAGAKPSADDLRKALEEDSPARKAPEKKTPAPRAAAKPAAKAAPKPAAAHKIPAHAPPDSDVALLSALVAHSQGVRHSADATPELKKELKACQRLAGSKARDCREEACLGFERSVAACK